MIETTQVPPPDGERRAAWTGNRVILVGLAACALSAAAGAAAMRSARHPAGAAEPPPFTVEKDEVRLAPGGDRPLDFDTAAAEERPPLAPPPVTSRVAAVESRSSASY